MFNVKKKITLTHFFNYIFVSLIIFFNYSLIRLSDYSMISLFDYNIIILLYLLYIN